MANITIEWHKADESISGLVTDEKHEITVKREAIPIIFVPGIMGSRLRLSGKVNDNEIENGLDTLRWDPGATRFTLTHYFGASAKHRKAMLIGKQFYPDYLEVANADGDGWQGIFSDYFSILNKLKNNDWGELNKIFTFPVYAFGYNWTDSNDSSGQKLAERIVAIKDEAKSVVGACQKVILITHSMGGLVARSASKLHGAESNILGIIHGVQPAYGSAAAYWRMKAGFDGGLLFPWILAHTLGPSGKDVTAVIGNSIGGLELLPSKSYRTNDGAIPWLKISDGDKEIRSLPNGDPYSSIYSVQAVVKPPEGSGPNDNKYWGLIDPELLTPELPQADLDHNDLNYKMQQMKVKDYDWENYISKLGQAETFHDNLDDYIHPKTWRFHGNGLDTSESVKFKVESNGRQSESYPSQGFRGFFRDADGTSKQAVLQNPDGKGDGTVPVSSATFLGTGHNSPDDPANHEFDPLEHSKAYNNAEVQRWVICAVKALCKIRYQDMHG